MDDKGRKVLGRINGRVRDYDVDEQYAVIKNTIIAERQLAHQRGEVSTLRAYAQLFQGTDKARAHLFRVTRHGQTDGQRSGAR
jgi:hypothetical protein